MRRYSKTVVSFSELAVRDSGTRERGPDVQTGSVDISLLGTALGLLSKGSVSFERYHCGDPANGQRAHRAHRQIGRKNMPPSMALHSRRYSPPGSPKRAPPAPAAPPAAESLQPLQPLAAQSIEQAMRRDDEWRDTLAANAKLLAAAASSVGRT